MPRRMCAYCGHQAEKKPAKSTVYKPLTCKHHRYLVDLDPYYHPKSGTPTLLADITEGSMMRQ